MSEMKMNEMRRMAGLPGQVQGGMEMDGMEGVMRDIEYPSGVHPQADGTYLVESRSQAGVQYRVRFVGRGDCGERLWECDCPAGRRGRLCWHVQTIIDAIEDDGRYE